MTPGTDSRSNRANTATMVWDGADLCGAFHSSAALLEHSRDQINALNVFPVPDGDTGTNMALTMTAALDAIAGLANPGAGDVAARFAKGALMGARGNSGVILSQILRGFATAIQDRDEIDGQDIAHALEVAQEMAYRAVMRPVEGTMLTVIRGAAEGATTASRRSRSITSVLHEAVAGAQRALDATPSLLDILRQAGVIDAGGQGVVGILQGLEKYALGEPFYTPSGQSQDNTGADMAFLEQVSDVHADDPFGYCTNFMVFGEGFDFARCRAEIAAMGDSAVIVGDDSVIKVHIHTAEPDKLLSYALVLGEIDQIKIDNMARQTAVLTQRRNARVDQDNTATDEIAPGDQAILAVSPGEGISDALHAMGATHIVSGGQTMNPSTADLLKVIDTQPASGVIILPNSGNIILTADQVSLLTAKNIEVVATRSIPEALSALTAFNPNRSLAENAEDMRTSFGAVRTVELTTAVRDVELDGVVVEQGQVIGILNGELVACGTSAAEVAEKTLASVAMPNAELVSVFTGDAVDRATIDKVRGTIESAFPDAETELHPGGQANYLFIIGIE